MPRRRASALTEREAQILDILWARGHATADEIRVALPGQPHDSTVRTLLRVLEDKGHVTHLPGGGRTFIYRPVIAREKAQQAALGGLLARFFGGSAESLVLRLLEEEHLTAEELQALLRATPKIKKRPAEGGSQ
jgi:BlaI family transcriptional regulator, penicillinase repressor